MTLPPADWRDDLDALVFPVAGRNRLCFVHRLAFRALTGGDPARQICLAFFATHSADFLRAANAKIERQALPEGANLHLSSRDIRRAIVRGQETDASACAELRPDSLRMA